MSRNGEVPLPSDRDWLDPLITLSVAAAVTQTIRLATGMLVAA
jgi:alkanesulfonate monooxygenase SsuD/methylene tetrahydromethanopterin reductase-like flavin-dependent oxidoreductase (luciferase family)